MLSCCRRKLRLPFAASLAYGQGGTAMIDLPSPHLMKPKHVPSFNCFSSLSHLIHHSDQKYVVISYSNDPSDPLREHLPQLDHLPRPKGGSKFATFEVGEIGGSSRWWRGIWSLEDVKKIAVGPSHTSLAIFLTRTEEGTRGKRRSTL